MSLNNRIMDKKIVLFLLLLAAIFVVVFAYSATEKKEATREIAVLVNGQPIYAYEVDEEFSTLSPEQSGIVDTLGVIDFLIEKKLLLQEASSEGIEATKEEIDALYTDEAEELINQQNLTKESLMKRLSEQAAINKLLDKKTTENLIIKNSEIMQIYESNYKNKNISFEEAESEIFLALLNQKRENLKVSYINELKRNADIVVLFPP